MAKEGLKARHHALLSHVQKLYEQFKGFGEGNTGSKLKCQNLTVLLKQDFIKFYKTLNSALDDFLVEFIQCPSTLTKENIQDIREMQDKMDNPEQQVTTPSVHFLVAKPYVNKNVVFHSDPKNAGERFPKKRFLSLKSAVKSNTLKRKKIKTVKEKTYCHYEWKGSAGGKHKTIIYYRNDRG